VDTGNFKAMHNKEIQERPLVSVLMTAYNREKYIAEAIESVIASTYQNWELIIVDDCSKDQTVEIAKSYEAKDNRIKVYINEKNLGDYPNRNRASEYSSGKYIKYLDSDDVIYAFSLQIMVDAMEANPEVAIGLSYNSYNNESKLPLKLSSEEAIKTHFFEKGLLYIGPSGCIYKREIFNQTGGFGKYGVASDYEFNLRLACSYPIVLFQRDLIWWRIHSEQEFRIKENDYLRENYKIMGEFINAERLPLNNSMKKVILINYKKNNVRKAFLYLMRLNFTKSLNVIQITKPGFTGFIFALLPLKIRTLILS
jgi:glycosyltransferase involved in cell wall biosynthesis